MAKENKFYVFTFRENEWWSLGHTPSLYVSAAPTLLGAKRFAGRLDPSLMPTIYRAEDCCERKASETAIERWSYHGNFNNAPWMHEVNDGICSGWYHVNEGLPMNWTTSALEQELKNSSFKKVYLDPTFCWEENPDEFLYAGRTFENVLNYCRKNPKARRVLGKHRRDGGVVSFKCTKNSILAKCSN